MKKKYIIVLVLSFILIVAGIVMFITGGSSDNIYTVKFDTQSDTVIAEQKVEKGGLATEVQAPVKEGFRFNGWYLNDELFDFSTKITSNLTLVANWDDDSTSLDISDKAKSMKFDEETVNLTATESKTLSYTITPEDGVLIDAVWLSSDINIATVTAGGKVTGYKEGTAVISVKIDDVVVSSVNVVVTRKLSADLIKDKLYIIDTEGQIHEGKVTLKYEGGEQVTLDVSKLGVELDSDKYTIIKITE